MKVELADVARQGDEFTAVLRVAGQFLARVSGDESNSEVQFKWRFPSSTLEENPLYKQWVLWVEELPETEEGYVHDQISAVLMLLDE